MYKFILSLCIVAVAFLVQRFANQIDEQLNACGTGVFKDGVCECQHPYTGAHCEIVDCGYGKLIDSAFAYDTITTPKGPAGCECENQYWGYNCANCTSTGGSCTGTCENNYYGSRCEIMCKSGTENDKYGVEHREAGGTYNYFKDTHGFCLNYGDMRGEVQCREGRAGAHCQHQCLDCLYGSCNSEDGTCDCFDGYTGTLCELTCPGRCSGLNGVCKQADTQPVCDCYPGFTGEDCSLECCVEDRGTELSSVHGTCAEGVGGCDCFEEVVLVDLPDEVYSTTPFHGVGWEGSQCDCHENITCGGRGRCVEGGCECTANFQGARCDICADDKIGPFCQHERWQCPDRDNANGEFVAKNSRGDYACKCNSGFTGDTCEECIASAYPKTGDNMCSMIIPTSLCNGGSVNPNYDGSDNVAMCICDQGGHFDVETNCGSCSLHYYGPDCDYYCRESTATDALDCGSTGGVCSNSGPGCICPKGTTFSGTKAGGTCVTCGGDEGCTNGNCIEGRCRCDPNYYGDNCDITAPISGDKVCSGYPSVIIETAANCDLTADCLDDSEDAPVPNQLVAHQARIYDRLDQMFCHRDDTPKGLKNTQGCCVDKNGDGFCDKDKLESTDCTFINAGGNVEEGEVVNDICNKRVLEDETNVFEWCLSKEKDCTMNGVCEDPELCENRCDAGIAPSGWINIWEYEHTRTMTDVMSESWKFASEFPDPYVHRDSYIYKNPCPSTHPDLGGPRYGNQYWCYVDDTAHGLGVCNMYSSGVPPPEGGAWGSNQPTCVPNCKSIQMAMSERVCDENVGDITKSDYKGQFTLGQCADECLEADGFIWKSSDSGCYCTTGTIDSCVARGSSWSQYKFEKDANCYQKPVPALDANIDDVCVAGEMYDVCRDYLIPDDANVFNLTHKFTDKWEPMPNYQDCTLTKVISVNVDGKVVIPIDPIYAGILETTEDNTAVFGRYNNGDAAYTGNVNHMIDSISVFGKGFTGANKLSILIYNYTSDTCSDFVKKVGSHHAMCSQIKFYELDYDWGAFCKWRPTSLSVYATRMSTTDPKPVMCDPASVNSIWSGDTWTGCEGAQWHGGGFAQNLCDGSIPYFQPSSTFYSGAHILPKRDYYEACCDWTGSACVEKSTEVPAFDDRCYRQSSVCTAGCDNYQEGCEGLPLLSEHPTPMPAPCDQHWDDFCTNYMDFEHKEEGVCAYTECRCEGYGIGGPACDMQCPVPAGVDTELSCGSDLNMGRCIKDRGVIAFGVEQGKCDCFNGGNPAEGCAATCNEDQDCSRQIDTPFSFEYENCTALADIDDSKTVVDLNGAYTCHVFLRDSACNFFRGRCECATPFTVYTNEEKPIYLNPHSSYRIALMQGYEIDEYLPFTNYSGTVPDRVREAFDDFDPNFKCYKDLVHSEEVSCDWIRALKHFARGGSYRIGDCTNLAPGTDIEYQEPCSGHGFPQGGTCACDYAEEFETRSSGVGLSFEQPGLTETPWRGKACQFVCPGYDMKTMSSVCSGHGRCESDARCACDQGWTGYKCDLQCEAEQKPLTCSGHGVCDERSIVLRGDIVKQLDNARCDHLPECNVDASGPCTNETMTLARDRVIKSGDSIYHMYFDKAIKITTYESGRSYSVEFVELDTTSFTVKFGDSFELNPDINVCSDFTLKKSYKGAVPTGGPVVLTMIDSYGDGWNGFLLSVNGITYGSTFTFGTRQTNDISDLTGTIDVNRVESGYYRTEVSFEIRCKEGNALLLSGSGSDSSWTFENTCPAELTDAIVIKKDSTVVATLTEIGEFSVIGAKVNDVYTYSDIVSSIGGSLTVTDCSVVTRNAVLDDFSIEGTAVRHDYDFGSNIPFMPCQDRMSISREHPAHPLLPEMSSVDLECNMFAQKQVTENGADYFKSYQIMCGVCNCEESSQTGNWTGYDCRTPALGFYRYDARSQCPGMTADMNPCNGGGTCRWGSTDGLGTQIRVDSTRCYCGDVTDEATLETAPRSEYGVLVHASSHGTPLFYDEIDTFEKTRNTVGYDDIQPPIAVCENLRGLPYALDTMDPDYETRKRACYDACMNVDGTNKIVSDSSAESYLTFWDDISHANAFMVSSEPVPEKSVTLTMIDYFGDGWDGYDVIIDGNSYTFDSGPSSTATIEGLSGTVSVTHSDGSYDYEVSWNIKCGSTTTTLVSGHGLEEGGWSFNIGVCPPTPVYHSHCLCFGNSLEGCPDADIVTSWDEMDAFDITTMQCPAGTEPIQYAGDCLHRFKTDEPFSLIPSFQYCEMPDKSDQVLTIDAGQTGSVDKVTFSCYDSCINGQKLDIGGEWSDPLFWSKHTKEDITHFSVVTDTYDKGWCVCYATNVDDCKNGDVSVPLTSYPHTISYRINHHSHPYDLTTGSSNTIPALSSLTIGSCQKEFADEVFADKSYGPTITYKASSSVCTNAYELDGTLVTPDKDTKVYSTRLQETDTLYDRDPAQECANRCHAEDNGYDGFMILSYVSSGNINSCLCGKKCDTVQTGFPYFKMYSMRTVPDPYETDNTQSICHPSPLQLSNYKSDCSCKFGFTGNTCETARMMCLWNGEETDGTECICNDDGELNTKVSKYGCCTKGTYWEQDKYASFTPLSEFEPLPANRFYEDAFLYVCKPPETLLDYESDRERIIDIHNYVANTDEYLLTKPAVCGNAPETRLFTSTFQTLTSKSPDTFTVTRDIRTIVVDKDKTILELKEGSEPKEQCAAFCVSKNKGYKGFSIFTPTPTFQRSEDGPGHSDMTTVGGLPPHDPPFSSAWCEDDDYVHVYTGWFDSDDEDPNPGRVSNLKGVIDACWAGCTFRPRVSKTKVKGYKVSRPQNFWDVYGPDDISYIRISDSYLYSRYGGCICHTGNLDTCEKVEDPSVHTHPNPEWKQYYYHNYKVVRGDTECTCEPFIANMDNQTEFKDPMSYDDNEGWTNALPRTTERYDIQFPVDIEAESQNLGCFENIDGRVLKIDQLSGTSHSISAVETAYVDANTARSSVGGAFEDCYEECKYDDVFTYGFSIPELPRYNLEGNGVCPSSAFTGAILTDWMSYDSSRPDSDAAEIRLKTAIYGCPAQTFVQDSSTIWKSSGKCMNHKDDSSFYCSSHSCSGYFSTINKDDSKLEYRYKLPAHATATTVSDASECYKHCRYKDGVSGFYFIDPTASENPGLCACSTTSLVGCIGQGSAYVTRYSVSDDNMVDQFTELIKDGTDGFCYGMPGSVRTYDGTGDNPGEDFAGKRRACYDACANVGGENIYAAVHDDFINPNFWENYNGYDVINWMVALNGRCYCYTDADDNCEKTWKVLAATYDYDVYRRNPPPEEKTCTCYSGGGNQITNTPIIDVFQVTGTSVGTLMTVQKNPAVNPAPCNVNSYIALGDDIVGDTCNCPIGALEEAYIDVGFERAIVNGRCKDYTSATFEFTEQGCRTTCENDPHCDSYSYAPDDPNPCRTAIDCAGFEYKFEGLCGSGSPLKPDRAVGVLPNIKACRDRCADYKGFAYSESYRNCMCQDYEMTGEFHSLCGNGGRLDDAPDTVEHWTRYQHNFEPAAPGEDATIKVRQPLTTSKGRYCATGEEELYTVSITDPRADVYACAQNATLQGMEVARGSVNGLTFTCYVSNTYYAVGDTEAGIAPCGDFKETGGPQYILQAGMQRRIGIEIAALSYQKKAIKDDLFNKEIYPSDTPEGCKVHCDPYKYRHFQFSNRDKTCQCIKKEKSLLTLTGDPNDMNYEIYDFSAGLIDSPHEMCFCEGFYLVDGQAQACPSGKYSSKLTPCSAACTNCPIGQFSDVGASECGACVAGQIQTSPTSCSKCPAGKFARSGDIVCRACEIGTYSIGVGAGRCTLCPTGKYQDPAVVGTTTNTCKDCPEGWEQPNMEQTDCKFCGVGKYTTSEGTAECLVCSSGKYQNQNEQKSADACHDCSAGKYQEQTGKSSCKNCAAGKYQSQTGKTSCPSCSAGKYQGQTGKTSCVTCGAGKSSAAGALTCATCGAGKYSTAGSSACSACNAGYYQIGTGKGSCTLCPAAATLNYKLGRFWNEVSRWGSVSGYGYSFHYPNPDRTKIDSCLYVQTGDYNLQGSNPAEGFNYDKVHCRYASQNNKINGYIRSKYVLRWCWIDRGNCRDVVNGRLVNYDLTETGRTNGGWKQCKPYHKGYRL